MNKPSNDLRSGINTDADSRRLLLSLKIEHGDHPAPIETLLSMAGLQEDDLWKLEDFVDHDMRDEDVVTALNDILWVSAAYRKSLRQE